MAGDDHRTTPATPPATDTAPVTRRTFIKTASVAAGALAAAQASITGAWAAGSDEIRIGLIGAGGRGTGAVQDAIKSSPGVRLVAMAELFPDRLADARQALAKLGAPATVSNDRAFSGLDGYKSVLQTDANYIILATPPGFRPAHLQAAIEAGKHVFTEKPVAVDGPGIRTCLSLVDVAAQKKLLVGCGLQRHHQQGYLETMKRIHDGAIGDIVAARAYWNQGALWNRGRKAEWSDTEWQLRNWYYFTWLCGDHIVEQHVHNIDVVNWALGQKHPVRAMGTGGRQVRTGPEWGHIYDHFAVDFEYDNGVHLFSMCRQQDGTVANISEALVGSKGTCQVNDYKITGAKAFDGKAIKSKELSPYRQEHTDFIASIRKGEPISELKLVAESTASAIMGREAAYTGKIVTFDEIVNGTASLAPATLDLSATLPTPPVPMPGVFTN
jgi:myo-inositol 2-dehydrogenase/D-chiro-inositol 1-dehydrogenase